MKVKRFDILNMLKNEVKQEVKLANEMQFYLAKQWYKLENYNEPLGLKKVTKVILLLPVMQIKCIQHL